jgi:hypothetical protein
VPRAADKLDISAIADLLAAEIASALVARGSYTFDDARRTNGAEGWTYELRRDGKVEQVQSMHLSEGQLSRAWLTANRRVDNDTDLVF